MTEHSETPSDLESVKQRTQESNSVFSSVTQGTLELAEATKRSKAAGELRTTRSSVVSLGIESWELRDVLT